MNITSDTTRERKNHKFYDPFEHSLTFHMLHNIYIYIYIYICVCGLGSSVGIVTDYGLDVPGSSPGVDEFFRPSRPAIGTTHPPLKWVLGLS